MINTTIEAPWYSFQKKMKALFGGDPEIEVSDVYKGDVLNYGITLKISNHDKYLAMDRAMTRVRAFGNVTLGIELVDTSKNNAVEGIELYKAVFNGNQLVKEMQEIPDMTGINRGYVVFWPEVIQFPDDDISDYRGNWSGLAQDIAKEIFDGDYRGVSFCTADIRENSK